MVRVLVIGYARDAVDFTDPAIPPGLTEALVAEGIKKDVQLMRDRGWEAVHLPIRAEGSLRHDILNSLGPGCADRLADGSPFVAAQIVHDDDIARRQGRDQELGDISGEALTIDRSIEDARSIDPVVAQCGKEGSGDCQDLRVWAGG